jgi:hypothetical protein
MVLVLATTRKTSPVLAWDSNKSHMRLQIPFSSYPDEYNLDGFGDALELMC